jgi:hypothetical protein
MLPDPNQPERQLNKGIVALVLAVVFFVSVRTHADPDLWGHVRFGQDILAQGIPSTDTYAYLNDNSPWINHELLAEILFAAAYNAFGPAGLVGVKAGLVLIIFALVYIHLWKKGFDELRGGIVIVAALMLMSVGLWTIRPQLLTYLFFVLTLLLIERAERGGRLGLWFLPVVMAAWANSHGGFLAGLAVVAIWVSMHLVSSLVPKQWRSAVWYSKATMTAVLAVCVGATLLNPYTWRLLTFLLKTATVARPEIGEWQPLSIISPEGAAYIVVVAGMISAVVWSTRPRSHATLAVLFAVTLLPLLALRHLPLFALAFVVFAAEHVADVWNRALASNTVRRARLGFVPWTLAAAFVVLAIPYFNCIRIDPSFIKFPARAVELMKRAEVRGNVATFFDWGEYIIWHLSPNVRVSVDGRRETVYSPESYKRSLQFLYGIGDWDEILERSETDMALIGRDQPTYALMRLKPGWQLAYEDSFSSLFVRDGSPLAEKIHNTAVPALPEDGVGLCFP